MRSTFFPMLVISLCLFSFQGESSEWNQHGFKVELLGQINSIRRARVLDQLAVDTIQCDVIERNMKTMMIERSGSFIPDSSLIEEIVKYIPDWNKRCFMTVEEAKSTILEDLQEKPVFTDAILDPGASHISLGITTRPNGDMWCVICIINRMVHLNPFEVQMDYNGLTSFTVSGMSPYKYLRVRFYKGYEGPTIYKGTEDECVDVETNETGQFRVILPLSKFGKGEYRIIIYVRETRETDYKIADHIHFNVRQ